jgi:hypothetical protein
MTDVLSAWWVGVGAVGPFFADPPIPAVDKELPAFGGCLNAGSFYRLLLGFVGAGDAGRSRNSDCPGILVLDNMAGGGR